jgi:large subunit ribosomal protein L15
MRDIIKKIPKLRGHGIKRAQTVHAERKLPEVINLTVLEAAFEAGDTVSPASLVEKGALSLKKGRLPMVKILGNGKLTKKIILSGCLTSISAKEAIEKAGGQVL